VKTDMDIELPEEIFGVKKWECTVISNDNKATFIKELKLQIPDGESVPFRAGGYIQIEAPAHTVKYADYDVPEKFTYRDSAAKQSKRTAGSNVFVHLVSKTR